MDRRRTLAFAAVLIGLALVSAGCASTREAVAAPSPSIHYSPRIVPADDPTTRPVEIGTGPVVTPTPAPAPDAAPDVPPATPTCRSLLDEDTRARVDRTQDGLVLIENYVAPDAPDGLGLLAAAGGITCNLGYLGTDNTYVYGWAALTADGSAELVSRVTASGYLRETVAQGALYCDPEPDPINQATACYLLRATDAVYSSMREELDARVALLG